MQRGEHADVAHHVVVAAYLLVVLDRLLEFCSDLYGGVLPRPDIEVALL